MRERAVVSVRVLMFFQLKIDCLCNLPEDGQENERTEKEDRKGQSLFC